MTADSVGSGTKLDGFTITNGSAQHGGGICCYRSSSVSISNSIISSNSATSGGGIYLNDSSPTISNNIITGNSASAEGGGIWVGGTSSPTIDYNDVWNNSPDDYYGCSAGANDISLDPLFVDPVADDYHLQSGSPCIDAGNNVAATAAGLTTDFEGGPRIVDGDGDTTAVVDMGTDEYFIPPAEVWVDDSWTGSSHGASVDGHTFGTDAFATIQDGIDAVAGSTVHVAAGTYYENITLKDGVEVLGAGADVTTIDGGKVGHVVIGANNAVISGFTVTNAGGATYGFAGIYCSHSSPTITNNIICNNCIGIDCRDSSSPLIKGNLIKDNLTYYTETTSTTGSGILCWNSSNPVIVNNIIMDNTNGIRSGGSSPVIVNNTLHGNRFAGDSVDDHTGIYLYSGSSPSITNNIITGNEQGILSKNSSPLISFNDVWNNTGGNYVNCSPGANDISQDPIFVNPSADDYHLQPGSPCIDAGDNTIVPGWLTTDFEGDPRIVDGDGDNVAVVDMGADEYSPPEVGADTAIGEEQNEAGVVMITPTIVRTKNLVTDETIYGIPIGCYEARAIYDPTVIELLSVNPGDSPFDSPVFNTHPNYIHFTQFTVSGSEPPIVVLRLVPRLVGCAEDSYTLEVTFDIIASIEGAEIAQQESQFLTLQRGDVNGDGTVNVIDAMWGSQYLAGLRDVAEVNQLNMASVNHDDGGDIKDVVDCMFIAQYVVGLRDSHFVGGAAVPPPPPPGD